MLRLNLLVALIAALGPASSIDSDELHVVDLGTLGGHFSMARAINDRGEVVGFSDTGYTTRAFLWRDGKMIDLGTLGGQHSWALDVNNRGEVVGESQTVDGETHAFLWRHGRMTDLGTVDETGVVSLATSINDRGHVVGDDLGGPTGLWPFLWRNGWMTAIDEGMASAAGINDDGDVVGTSYKYGTITAVLWRDSQEIQLGFGYGYAVNDLGQVAFDAYLWDRGRVRAIPLPAGATSVQAMGLNERGMVVGSSDAGPFVARNGRARILPGTFTYNSDAVDINELGQIVGTSLTAEGESHAALWTR